MSSLLHWLFSTTAYKTTWPIGQIWLRADIFLGIGGLLGGIIIGIMALTIIPYFGRVFRLLPELKRTHAGWIVMGMLIVIPLAVEDLTGLVYADQNVLLDNLAGIGTLIGLAVLRNVRNIFYSRLTLEEFKVLIDRTYEH